LHFVVVDVIDTYKVSGILLYTGLSVPAVPSSRPLPKVKLPVQLELRQSGVWHSDDVTIPTKTDSTDEGFYRLDASPPENFIIFNSWKNHLSYEFFLGRFAEKPQTVSSASWSYSRILRHTGRS
jgi:hypothetical protein